MHWPCLKDKTPEFIAPGFYMFSGTLFIQLIKNRLFASFSWFYIDALLTLLIAFAGISLWDQGMVHADGGFDYHQKSRYAEQWAER